MVKRVIWLLLNKIYFFLFFSEVVIFSGVFGGVSVFISLCKNNFPKEKVNFFIFLIHVIIISPIIYKKLIIKCIIIIIGLDSDNEVEIGQIQVLFIFFKKINYKKIYFKNNFKKNFFKKMRKIKQIIDQFNRFSNDLYTEIKYIDEKSDFNIDDKRAIAQIYAGMGHTIYICYLKKIIYEDDQKNTTIHELPFGPEKTNFFIFLYSHDGFDNQEKQYETYKKINQKEIFKLKLGFSSFKQVLCFANYARHHLELLNQV
jgi:hypothetical protein